jgi:hypothetical protein
VALIVGERSPLSHRKKVLGIIGGKKKEVYHGIYGQGLFGLFGLVFRQ